MSPRSYSSTSRPPASIRPRGGDFWTSSIRSPARGSAWLSPPTEAEYCNRIALINGGKLAALGSPSELKRRAIHGEILLVQGDNPGAMHEALDGAPAVRDVAPFGSSLHIVVDDAARDRPAIETLLKQHELGWSRIELIKPTLEDVFVQLVGGDSGRGARS